MNSDIFTTNLPQTAKRPVLMLAPMEGVTNHIFREEIAQLEAVDFVATEFIRISQGNERLEPFPRTIVPLQIQFMASQSQVLAEVIARLYDQGILTSSDWIDLNVGCPSRRVNAHGAGAALLEKPSELIAIVQAMRNVHAGPLSIKTRLGIRQEHQFSTLLLALKDAPLDFITIHPRVRCTNYEEPLQIEFLIEAVECLPYPVIANGDIFQVSQGLDLLEATGVRGLMCGRGAIQNPLLFNDLRQQLDNTFTNQENLSINVIDFSIRLLERYAIEPRAKASWLGPAKEFCAYIARNPLIGREFFDVIKRSTSMEQLVLQAKAFLLNIKGKNETKDVYLNI